MQVHHYEKVPDFEDIGDGILRVKIPQPFYEDNNIYLIDDGEPVLIDCGYVEHLGLLQRALKKAGYSLAKIKKVFFTHNHLDHITSSLVLRSYSSALHYGMVGMSAATGDYRVSLQRAQMANNRLIDRSQQDVEQRKLLKKKAEKNFIHLIKEVNIDSKVDPILRMDVELQEGDVIPIGKRELGFLYTPGHNRWHLTPYLVGEGIYFSGDLILKNVPSIYAEMDGDLNLFEKSLRRLLQIPIKRLLPAHFDEPENPQAAIKLLLRTFSIIEKGIKKRLQNDFVDLKTLTIQSMGSKIIESGHYPAALAVIHSFVDKFCRQGHIERKDVEPPYEQYRWIDASSDSSHCERKPS